MKTEFSAWILQAWSRRGLWAWLMLPVTLFYRCVIKFRRLAYQHGWFKSEHPGLPVIVVGNIYIGGTGKTPLTLALIKMLKEAGHKPGVVSRGYGSATPHLIPHWVSEKDSAASVGDEPLMIHRRAECPVVVCRDRVEAAKTLVRSAEVDVILADDGLQHYRLQRDVEIAVLDGIRRNGNGFLLPSGPLREPQTRLADVDAIVCNHGVSEPGEYRMEIEICGFTNLLTQQTLSLTDFLTQLSGAGTTELIAQAGIGHPERFFNLLKTSGIHHSPQSFVDHYSYSANDIVDATKWVVVTEKDAVKLMPFVSQAEHSHYWQVNVEARIESSLQAFILGRLVQQGQIVSPLGIKTVSD